MFCDVEIATNRVIILGKGIEFDDEGGAHLAAAGQARADRFLEYYSDSKIFNSRYAQVVCTGGAALLAHGIELPDELKAREGRVTADYLIKNGVPHNIIDIEDSSTSTLTNFSNSMDLGYIKPSDFNQVHRLGVVTHPHHQKRAAVLAGKLGFDKCSLQPINTKESDAAFKESRDRFVTRLILLGASGQQELVEHEKNFGQAVNKIRGLIKRS